MSALPAPVRHSRLFLSVKRLFFGLEPVIKFGAGLIAVLDIEFVSAAADAFFERKFLDRGFLYACGCGHGFTSTVTVSQAAPGRNIVCRMRLRQGQSGHGAAQAKLDFQADRSRSTSRYNV